MLIKLIIFTRKILVRFLNEIVAGLLHLESLKLIVRDLTLPNCLLLKKEEQTWTVKLSDHAKQDDRYASRYVQRIPMRWLPGDIMIGVTIQRFYIYHI